MNAKTLEAVKRHGEALLAAFPYATEKDPIALCKKLRRIETAVSRVTTDYCNGTATMEQTDAACEQAIKRVQKLLGSIPASGINASGEKCASCGTLPYEEHQPDCKGGSHRLESVLFINRDPRGYALKLKDGWTRNYNHSLKCIRCTIYSDMGGYGILAPDLNR